MTLICQQKTIEDPEIVVITSHQEDLADGQDTIHPIEEVMTDVLAVITTEDGSVKRIASRTKSKYSERYTKTESEVCTDYL